MVFKKALYIGFFCVLAFCCTRKKFICPAYNTYFIHDQKEREQLFSPFYIDSLSQDQVDGGTNATNSDATEKSSSSFLDSFWANKKSNSKYQPKERSPKKMNTNGLLVSESGKNRLRNVSEIEMKVISIKPISKYSNADSSSVDSTGSAPSIVPPQRDTL